MLNDDYNVICLYFQTGGHSKELKRIWNRIYKAYFGSEKTPTNKSSLQFPVLEDVWTEVLNRMGKKHFPNTGSVWFAVQEAYGIIVGNKKR